MAKVNGTLAKDIALYFLDMTTDGRYTPTVVAKTVIQAKSLLESGYTKEEVIQVIDELIRQGKVMYSLGYVSASIGSVLADIKRKIPNPVVEEEQEKLRLLSLEKLNEVQLDAESTERNRSKARRFGIQRGKREERFINLFEEH